MLSIIADADLFMNRKRVFCSQKTASRVVNACAAYK